jgi:hypothetical protein
MFQVFYLEDKNYPYHDFILDGYNMEIYEHLMSYFPYSDTVDVGGLTFTGARISLNDYDFVNFLKFIRQYSHEFHIICYHHPIQICPSYCSSD